jgi:hypothetical protein
VVSVLFKVIRNRIRSKFLHLSFATKNKDFAESFSLKDFAERLNELPTYARKVMVNILTSKGGETMETQEPITPQLDRKLCDCGAGNVYCKCPPLDLKPRRQQMPPNSRGTYDGN